MTASRVVWVRTRRVVTWCEEHQTGLYLVAILVGITVGLVLPRSAPTLEHAINSVLVLLLFATFLSVPMTEVARAFGDARFLAALMIGNFLMVPALAWGLSRAVLDDRGLLIGVLLVLLTPCIDYVIVFTGLAGGAREKLLAAAPLLMLAQMLLLPAYLYLFAGRAVMGVVELQPFAEAFLLLIVVPLATAAAVQVLSQRHRAARLVEAGMAGAMVPLMMATLAVVIGSQIAAVGEQAVQLARLVPLYAAYAVLAVVIGLVVGRAAHLDPRSAIAAVFSVSTRNSLVVLPLALALPAAFDLASLAVVTQTLVELVFMVALVRAAPRLVSIGATASHSTP